MNAIDVRSRRSWLVLLVLAQLAVCGQVGPRRAAVEELAYLFFLQGSWGSLGILGIRVQTLKKHFHS